MNKMKLIMLVGILALTSGCASGETCISFKFPVIFRESCWSTRPIIIIKERQKRRDRYTTNRRDINRGSTHSSARYQEIIRVPRNDTTRYETIKVWRNGYRVYDDDYRNRNRNRNQRYYR